MILIDGYVWIPGSCINGPHFVHMNILWVRAGPYRKEEEDALGCYMCGHPVDQPSYKYCSICFLSLPNCMTHGCTRKTDAKYCTDCRYAYKQQKKLDKPKK